MHAVDTTWAAQASSTHLSAHLSAQVSAAESTSSGGGIGSFLPLVILVLAFYLLILRPSRARAKAAADVQRSLAVGAEVLTTSGMYGRVTEVDTPGSLTLEIAPGVPVRFSRQSVVRVLSQPDAAPGPGPDDRDGRTDPTD